MGTAVARDRARRFDRRRALQQRQRSSRTGAEVNAFIEAWTSQRSKYDVMKILADAGVPCGACQDTGEVLNDPHLRARNMIVEVEHPVRGKYLSAGNPVRLSASDVPQTRGPVARSA